MSNNKRRKAQEKRSAVKSRRRHKKRARIETIFNLIPLVVVGVITILVIRASIQSVQTGPPAPDFTLQDVITERYYSLSVAGTEQIVVINFFGTQCPNCHEAMQTLLQLRNEFGNDISIISIAPPKSGDTVEGLKDYAMDNDFRWFIATDNTGSIAMDYDVTNLPTTVIVDRNQRIAFQLEGFASYEILEHRISTLLKEQPRVG